MEKNNNSFSRARMLRSNSRNKEKLDDKENRSASRQRKRSILSILPSSSSIQKPERGRSRNRSITLDVVVTNKVIVDHVNNNGDMDIEIQENTILSSQRQQQQKASANQYNLLRINCNDNDIERSDDESLGDGRSLSTVPDKSIWTFFTHIDGDIYQCRLCLNSLTILYQIKRYFNRRREKKVGLDFYFDNVKNVFHIKSKYLHYLIQNRI